MLRRRLKAFISGCPGSHYNSNVDRCGSTGPILYPTTYSTHIRYSPNPSEATCPTCTVSFPNGGLYLFILALPPLTSMTTVHYTNKYDILLSAVRLVDREDDSDSKLCLKARIDYREPPGSFLGGVAQRFQPNFQQLCRASCSKRGENRVTPCLGRSERGHGACPGRGKKGGTP